MSNTRRDSPHTRLRVHWAQHLDEVRQAQRLRYTVFKGEMGAHIHTPLAGHDVDAFDDYCEHLLVTDTNSGMVVGTYRALVPAQAQRLGRLYSDAEFDLAPLAALRPQLVELGRSCVHADYRGGSVILALWSALADFMEQRHLHTMMGCASISMHHAGQPAGWAATCIWQHIQHSPYLAAEQYRITPHTPLPPTHTPTVADAAHTEQPALLKGYLRLGARVLGAPAWDKDFQTADLPVMLHLSDITPRYRRLIASAAAHQG